MLQGEFVKSFAFCNAHFTVKKLIGLVSGVLLIWSFSKYISADDYFNPALLELDNPAQKSADLSVFEKKNGQPPGNYQVDIYLNQQQIDTQNILFVTKETNNGTSLLQPCLSLAYLKSIGVQVEAFPALKEIVDKATGKSCVNLSAIPQASAEFSFYDGRLNLSVPQAALLQYARGYVPPSQWDNGITALFLNYSLSGDKTWAKRSDGDDSETYYANFRPGFNLGAWRFRNYSTWSQDSERVQHWDSLYSYAQRNIVPIKGQLTIGDSNSASDVFDSIAFRGVQVASDDDMYPDSLKGYSPTVRGVARTNAQVTIRQNGYVIYQRYVPPGPFVINDLYPTGGSGDMTVTVKETDNTEQTFIVPYASIPVLQREGRFKYGFTAGQYRSSDKDIKKTKFWQATGIYGLPWATTAYGGVQSSSPYQSISLGIGKNMGEIGAVSFDVTNAWSKDANSQRDQGQSYRVRYSKDLVKTGTNFSIAAYHYSTSGFSTLQETFDQRRHNFYERDQLRRRSREEMNVYQNLWGSIGSLSVNFINESYWNDSRTMRSLSLGYNNNWRGVSYGVNYTHTRNTAKPDRRRMIDNDEVLSFNVSVPLDFWVKNTWATYDVSTSSGGRTTQQVGLSGTTLEGNNLNWNINQGHTNQGQGDRGTASLDYYGSYGEVTTGYSYDQDSNRLNYGAQGSVVLHENGMTFAQQLGDTSVLVKAPGASNVAVNNQLGVKTDYRGYTIVPYVTAYRRSQVDLDTTMLGDDVDLKISSQNVVPTRGALVRANFDAQVGRRVLMTLANAQGNPLPFGATVKLVGSQSENGLVGDAGQVYLAGLPDQGILEVNWGQSVENQCKVSYQLPKEKTESGVIITSDVCR